MFVKIFASTICILIVFSLTSLLSNQVFGLKQENIVNDWLAKNSQYRLATDSDCDCQDDIKQMRSGYDGLWKPIPNYHPYAIRGDFNGDGVEDYAAILVNTKDHSYALIIFNGPFNREATDPAFFKAGLDLKGKGLFYGPPRPKPFRLIMGSFEGEGAMLIPLGHSYKLKY
jgi:hypothetical protein